MSHLKQDVKFLIMAYVKHHERNKTKPIPCPLRYSDSRRWCTAWDAKFIDSVAMDLSLLYDLGDAADYLGQYGLRDLVCAKIAALARDCYPHELKQKLSARNLLTSTS